MAAASSSRAGRADIGVSHRDTLRRRGDECDDPAAAHGDTRYRASRACEGRARSAQFLPVVRPARPLRRATPRPCSYGSLAGRVCPNRYDSSRCPPAKGHSGSTSLGRFVAPPWGSTERPPTLLARRSERTYDGKTGFCCRWCQRVGPSYALPGSTWSTRASPVGWSISCARRGSSASTRALAAERARPVSHQLFMAVTDLVPKMAHH